MFNIRNYAVVGITTEATVSTGAGVGATTVGCVFLDCLFDFLLELTLPATLTLFESATTTFTCFTQESTILFSVKKFKQLRYISDLFFAWVETRGQGQEEWVVCIFWA